MTLEGLCALALAGSVLSFVCCLVTAIRSTPQRVRKAAYSAVEIAEQTQEALRSGLLRMATFQEEIVRERESAAGDLIEAERKRKQAAAKLSKIEANAPDEPAPQTLIEALASLPKGDPRRMTLLRQAKMALSESHA